MPVHSNFKVDNNINLVYKMQSYRISQFLTETVLLSVTLNSNPFKKQELTTKKDRLPIFMIMLISL